MADIRINALATTAASTASDDFIAVDGSANGTRKLNAYSPTFGGNLTVSGTTSTITLGSTNTGSIAVDTNGALTVSPKSAQTLTVTGTVVNGATQIIGNAAGDFATGLSVLTHAGAGSAFFGASRSAGVAIFTGESGHATVLGSLTNTPVQIGTNGTIRQTISSTGDTTFTGNLTVSGTGLSSFAGSLGIGTTSPTRPLDVRGSLGMQVNEDNAGTKVISIRSDFAGAGPAINVTTNDPLLFLTNNSERARITSGGNLLIGTTTDGGQKLQVSGTALINTGSSGSAVASNAALRIERDSNLALSVNAPDANVAGVYFGRAADAYYAGIERNATSTVIKSGGTTALTLDSSQNATFNGTILASSATGFVLNLSDTRSQAAGNGASIGLRGTYTGSSQTNFAAVLGLKVNSTDGNYAGKMVLQTRPNGGALTDALTLDDSQNATFAGSIAIGNTVNTVSPTSPNRTITMVIGGTTYYIHAKTTND